MQTTGLYNEQVHQVARGYCETWGESYNPVFTDITQEQGKRIADAFENAWDRDEYTRQSQVAYELFKFELLAQYRYAVNKGLTPEVWTQPGQPYANSREVFEDVKNNSHLYFFLTSEGFGSDDGVDYSKHPLLEKTGVILNGIELCYNDLFRIVHDYFGHSIYGFQFGAKGETNAWQSHLAMFYTKGAKLALTNEAQNQTCWFNYGKHNRRCDGSLPRKDDPDFVPLSARPYAKQAVLILDPSIYEGLATF